MTAVLADALAVLGLAILTTAVYGLLHFPDLYTKLHSASKAGFLGVAALLLASAVAGDGAIVARTVLIVALLSMTTPVAGHAVVRAARRRGEQMRSAHPVDES